MRFGHSYYNVETQIYNIMLLMSIFVAEVIVQVANEEEECVWCIALTSGRPPTV